MVFLFLPILKGPFLYNLMAVFPSLFNREYAKCNEWVIGMDGNFTHSLTRSFAHSLTRSLAHSLTRSLARSITQM